MMGKRPRIKRDMGFPVEKDDLEFTENKATIKARNVIQLSDNIEFDVWYDKHYLNRNQFGDENGERNGIEPPGVQELIATAIPHIIYYSARVKGFTYLNEGGSYGDRKLRIVLQDSYSNKIPLNIIIEAHFNGLFTHEITVKTAIAKEDFDWSDGQYAIELTSRRSSVLKLKARGKREEVASCDE